MDDRLNRQAYSNVADICTSENNSVVKSTSEKLRQFSTQTSSSDCIKNKYGSGFNSGFRVSDLSNLYIRLLKGRKVSTRTPLPEQWLKPTAKEDLIDRNNAVQIYKTPNGQRKIMDKLYDTTHRAATPQTKHWPEAVLLNKEAKDYNHLLTKPMKQCRPIWHGLLAEKQLLNRVLLWTCHMYHPYIQHRTTWTLTKKSWSVEKFIPGRNERGRACNRTMGIAHRICTKVGWESLFSCQLSPAEHRYRMQ